ncbi:hypothetical protein [Chitinophaga sp. MM2321]|uniref:hypothetical protein n=1 Tax=Chitinophaga sp. MM2321 TaxID=3137178 RepID=UPI0032D5A27A
MDFTGFTTSLKENECPSHLSVYLEALWYAGKGDWQKAHTLIEDLPDRKAARIHAYLHRMEGDIGNADYWYSRAGEKRPPESLEKEWASLVQRYLSS